MSSAAAGVLDVVAAVALVGALVAGGAVTEALGLFALLLAF